MPKQNYNEKEVAQIIKRAAELESEHSGLNDSYDSGPGLSLDELSRIAVEAGLDPENVRKAAAEISTPSQADSQSATVQNNEVICEQWVTGDFTEELADIIISDLNHRYNATHEKPNWKDNILNDASMAADRQSKIVRTGKSLEWKKLTEYGTEEIRVLIQPRQDQVRIRVIKQNIWGSKFSDSDGIGYLSFFSYFAGAFMFFALPFNLYINAIFGITIFALLQFALKKNSGWIQKKVSGSKNRKLDTHRKEVKNVARDLANLIEQPAISEDKIDLDDRPETQRESTDTRRSNSNRSSNRS